MARRKKKSGLWRGVPYAIGMLAGALIVSHVDKIQSPWHVAIPWALTALFFVLWRVTARRKVVQVKDENGSRPGVKRYV